ncbi:GNAT family N-acetyltransferase [Nonomuraea sp. NPDC050556]|uniref:GNAT family N-acetyltransferase n=1 Tax=Nonomuraea sp. NPDC050556 TaxID=3364369 RepID=UPI0037BC30F3
MPVIRDERPTDRAGVYEVEAAAFGRPDEADLVDALRDHDAFAYSLVAEEDGEIVGHIMFTWLPVGSVRALALAPLAVRPGNQGAGLGRALIAAGMKRAEEMGVPGVVVVGDPAYYSGSGFTTEHKITQTYGWPDEVFQAIVFTELEGEAVYPTPFGS